MFDTKKLKTSALIALGGFIISVVPLLASNLIDVINKGLAFDWRTPLTLFIGVLSTWIVASVRNFIKNQ